MRVVLTGMALLVMLFFPVEQLLGQGINHAYILDQAAKKYPGVSIPKNPLYIVNGSTYREDITSLDSALSDVDLSFDSVIITYLDQKNEGLNQALPHLNTSAIIVNIYRNVDTQREVRKGLKKALSMFQNLQIKTAHGPIFERSPEVMLNNILLYTDVSFNTLNMLDPSEIANITVLDSAKAVKVDAKRVNGFVKIRMKK